MGYTTEFRGRFKFNKPVEGKALRLLQGISGTRRMARNVDEVKYGVEGEFYFKGSGHRGQGDEANIIDYNRPPRNQPGLWCDWEVTKNDNGLYTFLEWNEMEKTYNYVEWLKYIIEKIVVPHGYVLNGVVRWSGEDQDDVGAIIVTDNKVETKVPHISLPHATYFIGEDD